MAMRTQLQCSPSYTFSDLPEKIRTKRNETNRATPKEFLSTQMQKHFEKDPIFSWNIGHPVHILQVRTLI